MAVPQPLLIEIIRHQTVAQEERYEGYGKDLFEQVAGIIELERRAPRGFVASISDQCEALGFLIDLRQKTT